MEVNLKTAEKGNIEVLKKMYDSFIEAMNKFDPCDCNMDDEINLWINRAINRDSSIIYIAEFEGEAIGFARFQNKTRCDKENNLIKYIKLSDLYVYNSFRHNGVATKLLKKAVDFGEASGAVEVVLNVYEKNTNARALYEKNGYIINAHISLNRIRMVKPIN